MRSTEERITEETVADGLRVGREPEGVESERASEDGVVGQHQGVGQTEVAAGSLRKVNRERGVAGGLGDAVVTGAANDRVEGVRRGGEADRRGTGEAEDTEAGEAGKTRGIDVRGRSKRQRVRARSDQRVPGEECCTVDDHEAVIAGGEVGIDSERAIAGLSDGVTARAADDGAVLRSAVITGSKSDG